MLAPQPSAPRLPFRDRVTAGDELASALTRFRGQPSPIVLGLPRGGVPVADRVARALGAPLDVMIVRKLGVPGCEELAMGAIASGGTRVLNAGVVAELGVSNDAVEAVAAREEIELRRRERVYRGNRPYPSLAGRTVILVDDGLATGATMRAAVRAVRSQGAARVVAAVPVGAAESLADLSSDVDEVVCLATPEPFGAIGRFYREFDAVSDAEVTRVLTFHATAE